MLTVNALGRTGQRYPTLYYLTLHYFRSFCSRLQYAHPHTTISEAISGGKRSDLR